MTATITAEPHTQRAGHLTAEALALRGPFPPRPVPPSWAATAQPREAVLARLLAPPFPPDSATG